MENIKTIAQLRENIKLLELEKSYKYDLLKMQLATTIHSYKPENIIKDYIGSIINASGLKNKFIKNILLFVNEHSPKNLLEGDSSGGFVNWVKSVLRFVVSTIEKE